MQPANNGYPEEFNARQAFGSDAEKLLKGAFLRICYDRGPYDNNSVDYNTEHKRTVRFEQFGRLATEQKFWRLLPQKQRGRARQIDYSKHAQTVQQYFSSKNVILNSQNHYDLICVNVGKPVRTRLRSGETLDNLMKEQSMNGAQWIPALLLQIKENQMVKSPLPSVYVSDMIRKALRLPAANAHLIQNEGLEILGVKDQPLKAMGFQVGDKLINLPARTLQQPILDYDGRSQTPRLAQWNLRDLKFRFPAIIERLHVVALKKSPGYPSPRNPRDRNPSDEDTSNQAKNLIFATLTSHGVSVNRVVQSQLNNYESGLRVYFKEHVKNAKDCTVILLPNEENESTYSYSTIKRISDFLGRHVICVKQKKLVSWDNRSQTWNKSFQIASNLALKINMKFSGENHRLNPKLLDSAISSEHRNHTIVMGADVAHPSPMARDGCPSVASVVGSVDGNFMRYQGSMRLQGGHQEKIEDMYSMVKERLLAWKESNKNSNKGGKGALPTNILFYRDGVSESQFNICEEYEINEIRKAYKELAENGDDTKLRLTFVVVVKRHHTRFYATDAKDTYTDKPKKPFQSKKQPFLQQQTSNPGPIYNGNLIPGLLVTDVVTNPKPNNFFLQSHKALQGTARSAHYHILEDGMQLGMNRIPELTHLLCYAFGRATTGVSYAAPAYIADRLCDRGMQYLSPWKDVTSDLEPRFKLSDDARTMTKEEITVEKQAFAVSLNELLVNDTTGEWPKTIEVPETETVLDPPEPPRFNPWHSNLDKGMFWM